MLVLAGGAGVRMGGAKPERTLGGRRLIDYALDAARGYGGPAAIGARTVAQAPHCDGFGVVVDDAGLEGPLAALAAGLRWARAQGVDFLLTLPCDAPFLPDDLAVRLRSCATRTGSQVVVPASAGRLHPACGLWRTAALEHLPDYIASGRRSLIGFAGHVGLVAEEWAAPAGRDPFFNVNTPADLAHAEAMLAQPHLE